MAPPDLIDVPESLARTLLSSVFGEVQELARVGAGWDCVVWRVGDDAPGALAARFPRRPVAEEMLSVEVRWLPTLADSLPLTVPAAVTVGEPGAGYPFRWSVVPWIPGTDAFAGSVRSMTEAGAALGAFQRALHRAPVPTDPPGSAFRGVPIASRTETVLGHARELGAMLRMDAVERLWAVVCATPEWAGDPVWCHGDMHPLNLIVRDGVLAGVIDWADVHVGEPSPDLGAAWLLLDAEGRKAFGAAYGPVDEATAARARGWALFFGVVFAAHGARDGDERFVAIGRRVLRELGVG